MVVQKREECQGHLNMDDLMSVPSIPLSVWAENEGNFMLGSVEQEEGDQENSKIDDPVTTSSIHQDIPVGTKLHGPSQQQISDDSSGMKSQMSKMMQCMEKIEKTMYTMSDRLDNLNSRVLKLETREQSPASPYTVPSPTLVPRGVVDHGVYHPLGDIHQSTPVAKKCEKPKSTTANGPPSMKLPTFDGQKNWNTFIFQFERVAKRYGWDDDERAYRLGGSFQDDALDYYSSL